MKSSVPAVRPQALRCQWLLRYRCIDDERNRSRYPAAKQSRFRKAGYFYAACYARYRHVGIYFACNTAYRTLPVCGRAGYGDIRVDMADCTAVYSANSAYKKRLIGRNRSTSAYRDEGLLKFGKIASVVSSAESGMHDYKHTPRLQIAFFGIDFTSL